MLACTRNSFVSLPCRSLSTTSIFGRWEQVSTLLRVGELGEADSRFQMMKHKASSEHWNHMLSGFSRHWQRSDKRTGNDLHPEQYILKYLEDIQNLDTKENKAMFNKIGRGTWHSIIEGYMKDAERKGTANINAVRFPRVMNILDHMLEAQVKPNVITRDCLMSLDKDNILQLNGNTKFN